MVGAQWELYPLAHTEVISAKENANKSAFAEELMTIRKKGLDLIDIPVARTPNLLENAHNPERRRM